MFAPKNWYVPNPRYTRLSHLPITITNAPHPLDTPSHPHPPVQERLTRLGVDTTTPGRVCHYAYLISAIYKHTQRHGTIPPPQLIERHLPTVDALAPTLSASASSHPFLLGETPTYLGARALLSKQGIPPCDPLHTALENATPRQALAALGRGVHFLAASAVLHLIATEHISPLASVTHWQCATAFTGADTFGAALRAVKPEHTMLAASEVD